MESKTFISHLCDVSASQVRCGTRSARYSASRFGLARLGRTNTFFGCILRSTSETPTKKKRASSRSLQRLVKSCVFYFTSDQYGDDSARRNRSIVKMQIIRLKTTFHDKRCSGDCSHITRRHRKSVKFIHTQGTV